ncbi:MAG: ferrous iron transport protein A [Candidatus Hydrogenedentes bacterium]|nr:ferrous iron transport protein A [Candidatus Hydrogenedentota bacterium]
MEDSDLFTLPLTDCGSGEEVEVVEMTADTALCARLRELGMVPGAPVRVARAGSPMILEVGESRFCLRGEDAARVTVRPQLPAEFLEVPIPSETSKPHHYAERAEWV